MRTLYCEVSFLGRNLSISTMLPLCSRKFYAAFTFFFAESLADERQISKYTCIRKLRMN